MSESEKSVREIKRHTQSNYLWMTNSLWIYRIGHNSRVYNVDSMDYGRDLEKDTFSVATFTCDGQTLLAAG